MCRGFLARSCVGRWPTRADQSRAGSFWALALLRDAMAPKRSRKVAEAAPAPAKKQRNRPEPSTLIEKQEAENDPAKVSKKRVRSAESVVNKQLRDHFPHWTSTQTDCLVNKDGCTLREVLLRDREAVDRKAPGAPTLGKKYYAQLAADFTLSESPYKNLRVSNDSETIEPDLLTGLEGVNSHPRSFQYVSDFLARAGPLNQKSLVLLFRQCLKFRPSGNQDVLQFLLGVVKFAKKHRVATAFPHEWGCVRTHFDQVFDKNLQQWKAAGLGLKLWWDSVKDYIGDVVPVAEFSACLAQEEDWSKVETQLCMVVQSSAVGTRAFGLAYRDLQTNKVSSIIKKLVAGLIGNDITAASVEATRTRFLQEVKESGRDPKEVMHKRECEVTYRGCKVKVGVHSYYDEYLAFESSAVEGLAVDLRLLDEVSCEGDLVVPQRQFKMVKIEAGVIKDMGLARRAAQDCLSLEVASSGESILAALMAKQHVLGQLSRGWRIQMAFWKSVTGTNAQDRLLAEVLARMPALNREVPIKTCLAKLDELSKSRLVMFCGLGLQAIFGTARQFVADVAAQKRPTWDGQHDSRFMKEVMDATGFFLTWTAPSSSDSTEPEVLYGSQAASKKYDEIRAGAQESRLPSLAAVGELQVFGWLLSETQRSYLDTLTDEVVKNDAVAAAAASALGGDKTSKAKSGRKKPGQSARDMVLNMLS